MGAIKQYKRNEIVSHETFLRPFPREKIMMMVQSFWEDKGAAPDSTMTLDQFFVVMEELFEFSGRNMVFGDMRYLIESYYDYLNDSLLVDVKIEKANVRMTMLAAWGSIDEYDIEDNDLVGEMYLRDIMYLLNEIFVRAEDAVEQWNQICLKHKPIITQRPPFDKMLYHVSEATYHLLNEEWMYVIDSDLVDKEEEFFGIDGYTEILHRESRREHSQQTFQDREHFIEDAQFPVNMFMYYAFWENAAYWYFGPFRLGIDMMSIDADLMIMRPYITIENVMMTLLPVEDYFIESYDHDTAPEMMTFFENYFKSMEASVIQWNNVL